ncbi:4-alpha-glucanotransferase [Antarctobacter heliothermus]|uniref:4-alpha-glucanotransferase n=1 Tax=Antarctobacter heliothermus TaxID=74033 RepID=A0A222DZX0_9RHOB|nr:4-alpha-glucanotransferase [Antarctobacter heliothermus]ASP19486.1 4-alpha-glucanotransferase [Antarctobacter heliothermus]
MIAPDDALRQLARAYGVHLGFHDLQGAEHGASPDTLRALLGGMGVDASTEAAVIETLAESQAHRDEAHVPDEIIATAGTRVSLPVSAPCDWMVLDESGAEVMAGRAGNSIDLDPLPVGYFTLHAATPDRRTESLVLSAPQHAPTVPDVTGRAKGWGVCGTLYGLRSGHNGGLGSYADLPAALRALAKCGAQFFGLNPIHALGWAADEMISPYSPTHRGFFSTDHIAPRAGLGPTPKGDLVDYPTFRRRQRAALRAEYARFDATPAPERKAFQVFRAQGGPVLDTFAQFEALSATHGEDFRKWPEALRKPGAEAARAASADVGFHQWLQWRAERQIDTAQAAALDAGMDFGLYLDLAVGARPGGAEVWMHRDTIAQGVSIGAPPDHLNPEGQSWNLAAHAPARLRAAQYKPLRAMLRKLMAKAGILRVDHALGLLRSFWIPDDGSPGGYVSQPFDSLLAVIAIEAAQARCVVVGEDLGLVPDGFREKLNGAGLLSYAVWQYETPGDGQLCPPRDLRPFALACFGTHDTPTIKGFWYGQDIAWWQRMGWLSGGETSARHDLRARQRQGLRAMCDLPPLATPETIAASVQAKLCTAPSALVALQLDDLLGGLEAQNLPGTVDQHPNWRRRNPVTVERLSEALPADRIRAFMPADRSGTDQKGPTQ